MLLSGVSPIFHIVGKEVPMGFAELIQQFGQDYLIALLSTWAMTAVAFAVAMVVAILITVMRVSPIKPLRFMNCWVCDHKTLGSISLRQLNSLRRG